MYQQNSEDDNYLQLSHNSAASGGSSSSAAGPQPYRNSYPMSAAPGAPGAAPGARGPVNASAPYAPGQPSKYRPPPRSRPVVYPEVAPLRPPPASAAVAAAAPPSPYAQRPYPGSTAVSPAAGGNGAVFWGHGPEIPPAPQHYLAFPAPPPLYLGPQSPSAPEMPYVPPRPVYYQMPSQGWPQQLPAPAPYVKPPAFPGGLYPQSAPISPAIPHDMYMDGAAVRPHMLNLSDGAYFSPGNNAPPQSAPVAPMVPYGNGGHQIPPQHMVSVGPPMGLHSRPTNSGHQQPLPQSRRQQYIVKTSPPHSSVAVAQEPVTSRLQIAYLRNGDRVCNRTSFTTLYHCLKPVDLVDKSLHLATSNKERHRGNLYPLYKVNEDWIAPNVGLPLKNKPGYRCILYVVDGTLLYDNAELVGVSGEKMLSKGTLHMFTATRPMSIYARNPSKTHRAHVLRLWIETEDGLANGTNNGTNLNGIVPVQPARRRRPQQPTVVHADFRALIRHVADADKQNCLLVIAQPGDYVPSFGMTSRIYGPAPRPMGVVPKDSLADIHADANSPQESAYHMSQSVLFTRPDYFTPEPMDCESEACDTEWGMTDPQLTSRACVDPLKLDEDTFVTICQLDSGEKVVYEPYDLHDRERAQQRQLVDPSRGSYRRIWIQTLLGDLHLEASANGGRLCVDGDMSNRMRPGDSAYVRRLELREPLSFENCGRVPIDFVVVETPY